MSLPTPGNESESALMLISVITPCYQSRADFLAAAYESLLAQQLPVGWDWEWLVQADGEDEPLPLPDAAIADPRVKPATGPFGGPAVARNLALARSRGELIAVLDADDILTPGALARSINALMDRPACGWAVSRALDLQQDGSLVPAQTEPMNLTPFIPRGWVFDYWLANNYDLPVHPATLCIRREWVMAMGGWMAMPHAEDAGLLLATQAAVPGLYIREVGLHYRKHDDQITRSLTRETRPERLDIIAERVRAIGDLLIRPIPKWQPGDRPGGDRYIP
ncbi:glycosyltransferase family 2 protein [Nocardia sp. NPDC056611]|uniref:glycosyltransferase family 2 protein n=1 Tax=Nocardia sp. NPDC056611 TaxID=3345877 RepID=UPI00366EE0A6